MKRLLLRKYNHLEIEDVSSGEVGESEVKVRVQYAGISYTDLIIQKGWYKHQKENMPLPYVPGFEAVGTIIEVGLAVTNLRVGDNVAILQKEGCFSEEIITIESNVIKLPNEVDMKWATSLLVNFFTAYHALNNIVRVFPESRILVESASGGVGGMLVQLVSRNCSVTGLVSKEEKLEYVKKLGTYEACTYDKLPRNGLYDVIFTASGENISRYQNMLSTNGKLVVYGFHSLVPENKISIKSLLKYLSMPRLHLFDLVYKNQTVSGFNIIHLDYSSLEFKLAKKAFLDEINKRILNKHDISCFPVEEFQSAFELLSDRDHVGKILLSF